MTMILIPLRMITSPGFPLRLLPIMKSTQRGTKCRESGWIGVSPIAISSGVRECRISYESRRSYSILKNKKEQQQKAESESKVKQSECISSSSPW